MSESSPLEFLVSFSTGNVDFKQLDWQAALNTGFATFASTIIPGVTEYKGAPIDKAASIAVWLVTSVWITVADVIDANTMPELPIIN